MNPLIEHRKISPLLLITLTLSCFALLPKAVAVVPPPDGGYPGLNTAEGHNALLSLTTGSANTAVGWSSLLSNAEGSFNTATGGGALLFNTRDENTAFGAATLLFNTTGFKNTAVGSTALLNNATGVGNTAIGSQALFHNTSGSVNTASGEGALFSNTAGSANVALGSFAGNGVTTAVNVICIGTNVAGANVDNSCYIGNIFGASIDPTNSLVGVDAAGKLGVTTSARRFKRDIQPMEDASEAILALQPVRFHYKGDVKSIPCFGLVAEDVEKVNPHLVVRDKNGEPLSVRYEQINAMLLNEFLKAHRTMQEQKATIAQLKSTDAKQEATIAKQQKQIEALTAGLQRVSDQLQLSKPAPKVVNNP
jgi:uncharacterized coiled-coil protein SlyX